MPRSILVVNVAWNSSQWKCPNINDFHNRHRYGFPFVQTVGFGYEWWNFDDVPNGNYQNWNNVMQINKDKLPYNPNNWYYGYFENKGKLPKKFIKAHLYSPNNPNIYGGIIVFISKNIYDGRFYFVGLYYDAFYLHGRDTDYYICDDVYNILNNLPQQIRNHILNDPNANTEFKQYNNCPNKPDLFKIINTIGRKKIPFVLDVYMRMRPKVIKNPRFKIIKNIIGRKDLSFILDKDKYVEIKPKDINVERFGQFPFTYKLNENQNYY